MFTVDKYLSKKFHIEHYNCWHFVRDVWFELTGHMLYDYTPPRTTRTDLWVAATDAQCKFKEVTDTVKGHEAYVGEPLIVLMQRARDVPHIGVLFKGKLLHLRPEGAIYQPLDAATAGFSRVLFYTTKATTP